MAPALFAISLKEDGCMGLDPGNSQRLDFLASWGASSPAAGSSREPKLYQPLPSRSV